MPRWFYWVEIPVPEQFFNSGSISVPWNSHRNCNLHHRFQMQSSLARLQVYLVSTQCLSLTCSADTSCHHNADCQANWNGYSHCFDLDSRKKSSMDGKSAMPQLRGCPEAFLWVSQHLNGFSYNLQKCFLSLRKLRAMPAPGAARVTSHRARSQLLSCSLFQ